MTLICRHCSSDLNHEVIDLGHQPPSNSYLKKEELFLPEISLPLKVFVCKKCWLMQLPNHSNPEEIFKKDYAYFSSTSLSWCLHAKNYVENVIKKINLNQRSHVVEIASNDGYLLQYFKKLNIPCLGIEPTHETGEVARKKGINTMEEFFGTNLAQTLDKADLVIANNVIAHVPDINDFIKGISILLKNDGLASVEFPHLLNLLEKNQFDTIYHEHFSYLSLYTLKQIANLAGLNVVEVEELATHGGSLRVWLAKSSSKSNSSNVKKILDKEKKFNLQNICAYEGFQKKAEDAKFSLLEYLLKLKRRNTTVLGYGAAAKGSTLLNYSGITSDLIPAVADSAKSKQGKYLPGSHIPIITPEEYEAFNPEITFVLPWNLIKELKNQFSDKKIFTAIPNLMHW